MLLSAFVIFEGEESINRFCGKGVKVDNSIHYCGFIFQVVEAVWFGLEE